MKRMLVISVMVFILAVQISLADSIPLTMSYQGMLTDDEGTVLPDGNYRLTFSLYGSAIGSAALWSETHPSVALINSVFSVILGSVNPMTLGFDEQYWLGITVDSVPELTPRMQLTSAAYSLNARTVVDSAITSEKIADSAVTNSKIDDGAITRHKIANSAVTGDKLSDATITAGKIAGGQVVKSLNDLTDDVTFAEGTNIAITPSGNTLTISATDTTGSDWHLTGNADTVPATHFLGTIDNRALEFRVNNSRVLRLEPHIDGPNFIAGSDTNNITSGAFDSAIGGGTYNKVTDFWCTVSGGSNNIAGDNDGSAYTAFGVTVGGGNHNIASGQYGTISGGTFNSATQSFATIGGGGHNQASGATSTIAGGHSSTASGDYSTVGGGMWNKVRASYGTIAGGGPSDPEDSNTRNQVTDEYGTIGGGGGNQAGDGNGTTDDSPYATVSGGESNTASAHFATVGGGLNNTASGYNSTVAGGMYNTASESHSTVGGGSENTVIGYISTLGGGYNNTASGDYSTVGGGYSNTASGSYSTIPGGMVNETKGKYSFAAGYRAKANHDGCFVWGDSDHADVTSSRADQFTVRANGGSRIFSSGNYTSLYVETDGAGRAGHFRIINSGSASDSVAASTQGSGNALVGYTTGSGWAGYFEGGTAGSSRGVYIKTNGGTALDVSGGTKSAVVSTSRGMRALYTEEATEIWFTDYGFGRLENGRVAIGIDPLFAETVNLGEPYHVFIQVNDPGCQGVAVTDKTSTGFAVVELRNGSSNAEFSYRIVAKRRGFESERLEYREMGDDFHLAQTDM